MSRFSRHLLPTLALAAGLLWQPACHGEIHEQPLVPGASQRECARGDWSFRYRLPLAAGDFARVDVRQEGADVVVRLRGDGGEVLLEKDSPTGASGTETVEFLAPADGEYRIEIVPFQKDQETGCFQVEWVQRRPATERDRARIRFLEAESLQAAGEAVKACAAFGESLAAWQRLDEPEWVGRSLLRVGECALAQEEEVSAVSHLEEAIRVFLEAGLIAEAVGAQIELGRALVHFGNPERALEVFAQVLERAPADGSRERRLEALREVGTIHRDMGATESAVAAFEEGIELAGKLDDPALALRWQARMRNELGAAWSLAGRMEEAVEVLRHARRDWRQVGSAVGESGAVVELGWIEHLEGRGEEAVRLLREALSLVGPEDPRAAGNWDRLGTALRSLGRHGEAVEAYREALALMDGRASRFARAHTLNNLAEAYLALGEAARALEMSREAAARFVESRQPYAEAHARFVMARALAALDRPREARQSLESVLGIIERLRYQVSSRVMRTSVQSSMHPYFEDYWSLLADLQQRLPEQDFERAGFEASERIRALTLRESMTGTTPGWTDRPEVPRLAEIQRELLDEETLLLSYALAEQRSYLWVISSRETKMALLPGRRQLEREVRLCHRLLAQPVTSASGGQLDFLIGRLSRVLLDGARDWLGPEDSGPVKRLLIVPDGALYYLPFAVLNRNFTDPSRPYRPLLEDLEIVLLPSAGTALQLRGGARQRPRGALAVIGDPVFSASDPRLSGPPTNGLPELARLPFPEFLPRMVPEGRRWVVRGFDASRETVLAGELGDHAIVHFGTHGVFDSARPQQSHLVLSLLDERGRKLEGRLRSDDIARLRLAAELVTLSACETGKGEEIRGEGLLGLAQAFLAAGSSRVVVTLWNVHAQATAELMERFYTHLLVDRDAPAEALRKAQRALRAGGRWSSPNYWAGVALLGDWRPIPYDLLEEDTYESIDGESVAR